jgi:hypothetical protein
MIPYELALLCTVWFCPAAVLAWKAFLGVVDCVEQKKRPRLGGLILFGLGLFLLLCSLALTLLAKRFNLHLYLCGKGLYEWQFALRLAMIFCLVWGGFLLAVEKVWRLRSLVCAVLLGGWLFLTIGFLTFGHYDTVYTEISSPASAGKVHELVFEEKSWLFGGSGAVYERVSPCFMSKLGDYPTDDDGCQYVASGSCRFLWREDGFTMKYRFEADIRYDPDGK